MNMKLAQYCKKILIKCKNKDIEKDEKIFLIFSLNDQVFTDIETLKP